MSALAPSAPLGNKLRQMLARLLVTRNIPGKIPPEDWNELSGKRVAVLKWDGIGDFILATTFLRKLQAHLPAADVTLFCQSHLVPLIRSQFPTWTLQEVAPRTTPLKRMYGQLGLRTTFQNLEPFDVLIDLRSMRDMGDAVMASWIPARCKVALKNQYLAAGVGFSREDIIYDHLLQGPDTATQEACLDILNYRRFVELFIPSEGAVASGRAFPELSVTQLDRNRLIERLDTAPFHREVEPFLLVCPGSLEPIKEYPAQGLAEAIRLFRKEFPIPVVVAGSEQDRRTTDPLRAALGETAPVLDLTGRLALDEHAVLVSMATAVLCMDSSTAHMAGALSRPAVVILGGGHPGIFAPWGADRRFRWVQHRLPCYGCNWVCVFDKPICIRDISPDFIARNLLEVVTDRVRG